MDREALWVCAYSAAESAARTFPSLDASELLLFRVGGVELVPLMEQRIAAGEVLCELRVRRIVWQAARFAMMSKNRRAKREADCLAALEHGLRA